MVFLRVRGWDFCPTAEWECRRVHHWIAGSDGLISAAWPFRHDWSSCGFPLSSSLGALTQKPNKSRKAENKERVREGTVFFTLLCAPSHTKFPTYSPSSDHSLQRHVSLLSEQWLFPTVVSNCPLPNIFLFWLSHFCVLVQTWQINCLIAFEMLAIGVRHRDRTTLILDTGQWCWAQGTSRSQQGERDGSYQDFSTPQCCQRPPPTTPQGLLLHMRVRQPKLDSSHLTWSHETGEGKEKAAQRPNVQDHLSRSGLLTAVLCDQEWSCGRPEDLRTGEKSRLWCFPEEGSELPSKVTPPSMLIALKALLCPRGRAQPTGKLPAPLGRVNQESHRPWMRVNVYIISL